MTPRLKEKYNKEIVPAMMEEFGVKNKLAIPRITKISVNVGVGKIAANDAKAIDRMSEAIAVITGQKPKLTKAKKSIAGFKLREGMSVGLVSTLRGNRMYEFLDRLINVALPRVRDFRGVNPKAFDRQGNYSIGIQEHMVFPEIELESSDVIFSLQANITINKKSKEMGYSLLKNFGVPFREQ